MSCPENPEDSYERSTKEITYTPNFEKIFSRAPTSSGENVVNNQPNTGLVAAAVATPTPPPAIMTSCDSWRNQTANQYINPNRYPSPYIPMQQQQPLLQQQQPLQQSPNLPQSISPANSYIQQTRGQSNINSQQRSLAPPLPIIDIPSQQPQQQQGCFSTTHLGLQPNLSSARYQLPCLPLPTNANQQTHIFYTQPQMIPLRINRPASLPNASQIHNSSLLPRHSGNRNYSVAQNWGPPTFTPTIDQSQNSTVANTQAMRQDLSMNPTMHNHHVQHSPQMVPQYYRQQHQQQQQHSIQPNLQTHTSQLVQQQPAQSPSLQQQATQPHLPQQQPRQHGEVHLEPPQQSLHLQPQQQQINTGAQSLNSSPSIEQPVSQLAGLLTSTPSNINLQGRFIVAPPSNHGDTTRGRRPNITRARDQSSGPNRPRNPQATIQQVNTNLPITQLPTQTHISSSSGICETTPEHTTANSGSEQLPAIAGPNNPPVSVSSTTRPPSVSEKQSVEVQVSPEVLNKACQYDSRIATMISRAVQVGKLAPEMVDAECQSLVKTYVDRACSPILFPFVPVRKKVTAKRKKLDLEDKLVHENNESDSDTDINVVE